MAHPPDWNPEGEDPLKELGKKLGDMLDQAKLQIPAAGATFECPFCGGQCATTDPLGVLHSFPLCERFNSLEPVEFLHAVNVALGNHQ